MGSYVALTYLKKTKARKAHTCSGCEKAIEPGEHYFVESITDPYLHLPHPRKFCAEFRESLKTSRFAKRFGLDKAQE